MPRKVTKPRAAAGPRKTAQQKQQLLQRATAPGMAGTSEEAATSTPVYFWRETDPETGYLSQWYDCAFADPAVPGKIYKTAEHYMMHHKALLFGDAAVAAQVLDGGHPRKIKALGRKVKNFDEAVWVCERERIVEEGNYAKFTCAVDEAGLKRGTNNTDAWDVGEGGLRSLLLSTDDRELVEASPFDRIWGVGFAPDKADDHREEWGLNLLGKALVAVREKLRKEDNDKVKAAAETQN